MASIWALRPPLQGRAVMLHHREGVVEAMEQLAPGPVTVGLPEADAVGLDRTPPDEQQVAVLGFDAGPHFHLLEALGRLDQRPRLGQRRLEGGGLALADVEDSVFENHSAARIFSAIGTRVMGSTMPWACSFSGTPG